MKIKKSSKGFTMVESILSITLIGILFALTGISLTQGLDAYRRVESRVINVQALRHAMDRIVREIIQIDDATNLQQILPQKIVFVDDLGASTTLQLSGTNLMRDNNVLLPNVTGLIFTGYGSNNQMVSQGSQTWRVRIQLTTTPPGEAVAITLRTDIFLRNYMYENFK